jgi:hypothetical protein
MFLLHILICQLQKIVNKYKYQNDYKKYSIPLLILLQECAKNIDITSSSIDDLNFHGKMYKTQIYKDIITLKKRNSLTECNFKKFIKRFCALWIVEAIPVIRYKI